MRRDAVHIPVDGEEVAAVHERPEEYEDTVVFCHGFGGDKDGSFEHRAELAVEAGFASVRFDFRGNNESSREFGDATLSTRIADLRAVLDWVGEPSCVYGTSFGGLVAMEAAVLTEQLCSLALRAPVTGIGDLEDVRSDIGEQGFFEIMPGKRVGQAFLDDLGQYDFSELRDLTVPTLFMHGETDEKVDWRSSRELFEALDCEKQYVRFPGQGHRFSDAEDDRAVRMACDWFRQTAH